MYEIADMRILEDTAIWSHGKIMKNHATVLSIHFTKLQKENCDKNDKDWDCDDDANLVLQVLEIG